MTNNPILRGTDVRKVSLLCSLRRMNSTGNYPRISELVAYDDGRQTIPRHTIVHRRSMVRALISRGFVAWTHDKSGHPVRLEITHAGHLALTALGK